MTVQPTQAFTEAWEAIFSEHVPPAPDQINVASAGAMASMIARKWVVHDLYRWYLATGSLPTPKAWASVKGLASLAEINELFDSWHGLIAASEINDQLLPRQLPALLAAAGRERSELLAARRRLNADRRDVTQHEQRLQREREQLRDELAREHQQQTAALARDTEQRLRLAGEHAKQAQTARQQLQAASQGREHAVRRAHALALRLAELLPASAPQFRAWLQFPAGSYEALLQAAADALADSALRQSVLTAPAGLTQLAWRDGVLRIDRQHPGPTRSTELSYSEPLDLTGEDPLAESTLTAHRRITLTIWEDEHSAGVLTEVHIVEAPAVLPTADLAEIAHRLAQAAIPEADAGWPVGTHATRVGEDEVEDLVELLRDGARSRPVLVLTRDPAKHDRHGDPDQIAAELFGAAHVVEIEPRATFRLTDLVTPHMSVWGGQARCYHPGFTQDSPPRRHPRLVPADFDSDEDFHQALLQLAATPDRTPGTDDEVRSPSQTPTRSAPEQTQLNALLKRTRQLDRELAEERERASQLATALAHGDTPQSSRAELRSVADAAALARAHAKHLNFAPQAFKTAAESLYRPPSNVYDALMLLDQIAGEYIAGEIGVSVGERARQLGLTWRADVSQVARTKYAREYECDYEGTSLPLAPHLVIATGTGTDHTCRVYFYLSDGRRELPRGIYVGHIGRHLPDSNS